MPSINRRIRLAVSKVFLRYGIDNLQLEIDLVAAVKEELQDLLQNNGTERKGTMAALEAHEERVHTVDTSGFPEDVAGVIEAVCMLWLLTPPAKRKGGEYARWIECARDVIDACAEMDVNDVLHRVHTDYMMSTAENNGKTPYIVSGPCQLVKVCRAKTGQLRGEQIHDTGRITDKEETSFSF